MDYTITTEMISYMGFIVHFAILVVLLLDIYLRHLK